MDSMNITDLFIRRPVLALVVSLVIIIAGLQAVRTLNVRQYPRSENAAVTVTTVYVGADADLVRGFVTSPLERAIAAADGIEYMESQSTLGLSTIKARLRLNFDSTKALAEISSKVDQVRRDLPPEAEVPAINIESADSEFASAYLSFTSGILQQNEITDYLARIVQPRLSAVSGVQRADILGGRTFAMRIWLKPERMAALNISPAQVRQALAANNFLAALGRSKGALIQVNLTADTNLSTVEEFRRLAVREQDGSIVRLGEIADVALGAEDYDAEVRFSGQTAVFMGIWPLPNANSIDVLKRVRAEMAAIQDDLPTGLEARVAYDATEYINSAIREVLKTLGDTLLIVVVVIFLFLGSFRSVFVPVVAIPVSLIGGVFLMQAFGFTVNLLTLLAIVLSVGLVVDDAIVVVENVARHIDEGKSPLEAALQGARELVGPIIAMTITLAAVYLPIGLQGGLTGSLFREFAFTLAGAVAISGVVALTLSPVMSATLLKPGAGERGLAGRISRDFKRLRDAYGRLLDATLRARPMVYTVWITVSLRNSDVHHVRQGACAPGGPGGHLRHPRGLGQLYSRPDQPLRRSGQPGLHERARDRVHLPDHLPQLRLRRHGHQTVERPQAHRLPDPARGAAEAAGDPRHPNVSGDPAGPPRRRPVPGGVHPGLHGRDRTDPRVCSEGAAEGDAERHVRLPAAHRRQDRPTPGRVQNRPRQGRRPRSQPGTGRRRPGRDGRG
jgi:multidrug efflux pump